MRILPCACSRAFAQLGDPLALAASVMVILSVLASAAHAQVAAGSLDTTFGDNGGYCLVQGGYLKASSMAVDPSGYTYVVGSWHYGFHPDKTMIGRITAAGVRDENFASGGIVYLSVTNDEANTGDKITQHPERGLTVSLVTGTQRYLRLISTLGNNTNNDISLGSTSSTIAAIDTQSDSKVLVLSTESGTRSTLLLRRYLATGALDTSFSGDGSNTITDTANSVVARSLLLLDNGKILVGAYLNTTPNTLITARFLSNGSLDTTYGTAGTGIVRAPALYSAFASTVGPMALDVNGQALAAGTSSTSRLVLASCLNGALNTAFSGNGVLVATTGTASPSCMARRSDGKLFVGVAGTAPHLATLAAVRAEGVLDGAFGTGGFFSTSIPGASTSNVVGVGTLPDGKIIAMITSQVSYDPNSTDMWLVRFHTDGTPSLPAIRTDPVSRIVTLGSSVSFTVTAVAGNTATPTYQWRRNGQAIGTVSTSPTITLTNVQVSDEGSLTVDVINPVGSVTSNPASLTVLAPPVIKTPPVGVNAMRGPDHTFSVTVTGRTPLTYQWQKDNVNYGAAHVTSLLTDTLVVPIDEPNEGAYRCVITNSEGSASTTPVNLVSQVNPPVVTASPTGAVVTSSASTSIPLSVTVTGWPPFTFQWQKDNADFGSPVQQSGFTHTLTLPSNTTSSGQYRCLVTNSDSTAPSTAATVTVVASPPVVTVHPQSVTSVATAGNTVLNVSVSGRTPFTFQWQKDNASFGAPVQQSAGSLTLTVPMQIGSSGVYRCVITNTDGTAYTDPATLVFRPAGTILQRASRLLIGDATPLTLQADVFTTVAITATQWQFNNRNIAGANATSYTVPAATYVNAGAYRLQIGTISGISTSDTVSVAVVESLPRTVVVATGKPVSLTAKTAGDGLTFLWRRVDGQPLDSTRYTGINTAILKIAKADATTHAGGYICDVSRTGVASSLPTGRITLAVESEKPVLDPDNAPSNGAVARPYRYPLLASHTPTSFTASGLPPGVKCGADGVLSGLPTRAGTYKIKVTAANPVGASPAVTYAVVIDLLPRSIVGLYKGPVVDAGSAAYRGSTPGVGTFTLTVSEAGTFTGSACLGTVYRGKLESFPFTGTFVQQPDGTFTAETKTFTAHFFDELIFGTAIITWSSEDGLSAIINAEGGSFGGLTYNVPLHHNPWNARTAPASAFTGYHTVELASDAEQPAEASGSGYGSFTVSTAGTLTLAGKLPDGTAYAIPAFIDANGAAWIFQFMYSYNGYLSGDLFLSLGTPPNYNDSGVAGALSWLRPPMAPSLDPTFSIGYMGGVSRNLDVIGSRYLRPNLPLLTGPYMMNAAGTPPILTFDVTGGGLEGGFVIDGTLSTKHVLTPFPLEDGSRPLSNITFNPTTGTFSGSAVVRYYDIETYELVATYRPSFFGIVTRPNPTSLSGRGTGFFAHRVIFPIYYDDGDGFVFLLQNYSALLSGHVKITSF